MDPTLSLEVLAFLGASLVALVHLFIARIRVLDRDGAIWLDVLAGVALGYVFVDLMPHLAGMQEKLLEAGDEGLLGFLEHHAYLVALAGVLFYMAAMLANRSPESEQTGPETLPPWMRPAVVFNAGSLALYSFIIGDMVAEQFTREPARGLVFSIVMAAHVAGLDHLYRHLHPRFYDKVMRYLLAGSVYLGLLFGFFGELSPPVYALIFSFLAGGLIIVTAIYELPRIKSWRPYAGFCAGAIAFTFLILIMENLGR